MIVALETVLDSHRRFFFYFSFELEDLSPRFHTGCIFGFICFFSLVLLGEVYNH